MSGQPKTGPIFVGRCRLRYRWRGIRIALRCLWYAVCGFELAGHEHGPNRGEPNRGEPNRGAPQ